MKELEKNLEATGGVPAEAELAAINRFAKSPLRAEEVYTFSLRLCDNEVDRDWAVSYTHLTLPTTERV